MKILLTGATGFLGGHLIPRLLPSGSVRALCRTPVDLGEGVEVVQGDILQPETLPPALEGCELLIHAAGSVSHHRRDAEQMWSMHVLGSEHVLKAAQAAGVRKVIFLSTSGTHAISRKEATLDERAPTALPLARTWPYYRNKIFAEEVALAASSPEMGVVCLNPSLLLGPGDRRGDSTRSVRMYLDGQVPAVPPGGISFVDVRDVADAVVQAVERGRPGERYLLASGNMTFLEFYRRLGRLAEHDSPLFSLPQSTGKLLSVFPGLGRSGFGFGSAVSREEMEMACHFWYADSSKAKAELGWTPRDPTGTLSDTIDDLRGLYRAP